VASSVWTGDFWGTAGAAGFTFPALAPAHLGMSLLALWLIFNLFTVNWRFNLEKPSTPPPFTPPASPSSSNLTFQPSNLPTFQPLLAHCQRRTPARGQQRRLGLSSARLNGNTPLHWPGRYFYAANAILAFVQLMNVRYVLDTPRHRRAGLKKVFAEGELKVFEMAILSPAPGLFRKSRLYLRITRPLPGWRG